MAGYIISPEAKAAGGALSISQLSHPTYGNAALQFLCWPIHKTLCKVDPSSFRFPPLRTSEIQALEAYAQQSYGGPMTTYENMGTLLDRLPTFLPPWIQPLTWPLYNYLDTDAMPHSVDRTWVRIAHHAVSISLSWQKCKYGADANLRPGDIFRVYNGYLRQCALFQWARDIVLEAVRTDSPRDTIKTAGGRALELIKRANTLRESEGAGLQLDDRWMEYKMTEYQLQMQRAAETGHKGRLRKEDARRRVTMDQTTGALRPAPAATENSCAWCERPATSRCGACQAIRFCSQECQRACWPIHKSLCKVDPSSFRFPPLRAQDIEALEKYKDRSYAGPMTTFEDKGNLFERILSYLPRSALPLTWPDIVRILESTTPTERVNEAVDIRELIHAHARGHLYNCEDTDAMPHGAHRTWIRLGHHVVTVLYSLETHTRLTKSRSGEPFLLFNGYLRQCALFQWARDIALEAGRTLAPPSQVAVAATRAIDLIKRATATWEEESAAAGHSDGWVNMKLSEYQGQMHRAREGDRASLRREDPRPRWWDPEWCAENGM
ncbi:hypothetical protein JCM10908_005786 [Rhodotorula pacifica]|uniref:zinc finger MYND domain-containing protein n=1 Tax=Rhodotorula pacifica TaxID=1495444 RepID=UPI00316B7641